MAHGSLNQWLKRTLPLALLFSLVSWGLVHATESGKQTTIPLSIDEHNRLHVYFDINGEKAVGTIDTAATFPLIDNRSFDPGLQTQTDNQVEIMGVNGTKMFDIVELDSITAGNQRFRNVAVASNKRANFPGPRNILPAKTLIGRTLDFNFPRNRLDVYDRALMRPRYHRRSWFHYTEIEKLLFIEVSINGTTGLALIDTGSDTSYLNAAFVDAAKLAEVANSAHQMVGADGRQLHIRAVSAKRLKLGRYRYRKFEMLSADTEIFEHLGLADTPAMVLGMDVLQAYRLQIDREAKRIHLLQPHTSLVRTNVIPSRLSRDATEKSLGIK